MTSVDIFIGSEKVSTKSFERSFYIWQDYSSEKLIWHTDNEKAKTGIMKLWIQLADTAPQIAFVLPDWRLTIDGKKHEQEFYEGVENLAGKVVELAYRDYRFVFQF